MTEFSRRIVRMHKERIQPGDVILENGVERTLCKSDFKRDSFMGLSIRGNAYPHRDVVIYQRALPNI